MIADFLLVQKIRNGDNQAGNQLVEKYYSSIYQYCYLHTHNPVSYTHLTLPTKLEV